MISRSLTRSAGFVFLAAALLTAMPGCSSKSKLERHLANAQKYAAAGKFDAAEIEYVNVQRLDQRNAAAMAGLAAIYFEQGSITLALPRLAAARELAPDDMDNRVRLARVYLGLGGVTQARAEAVIILAKRADDAEALSILAESSVSPEDIADARSRLTGDTPAAHAALSVLDLREKHIDEATAHAERAIALDPKFAAGYTALAGTQLARRDHAAARESLERAAELSSPRSPRRLALVRFLLAIRDTASARQTLANILKDVPDFLPASIMSAELEAGDGHRDEALKILAEVQKHDPDNPDAGMLRATVLLARGENAAAIEQLEKLVNRFTEAAPMHLMLANAYASTNDTARAMTSVNRVLQLVPDLPDGILLRAALQIRSGDPAAAILALREVIRKDSGQIRARALLADALRARGQPDEALAVYAEAINLSPRDAGLHFYAGAMLAQLGRIKDARHEFEQSLALREDFTPAVEQLVALDIAAKDQDGARKRADDFAAAHPNQAEAHLLVAKTAGAQGDLVRTEAALKRAIEVNPDSAAAYTILAQLYITSKREDEALAQLKSALAKKPTDISTLMLTGMLQQQKGDIPAAREAYEKLLQVSPRFVPALNNLAYIYSENLGQLDRAYELANTAREIRPGDPIAMDTFGWILFQRRDFTWALSVLNDSAAKLPDNAEIQYHAGMARYVLGDEAGARAALTAAVNSSTAFLGKDKAEASLAVLDIDPDQAGDAVIKDLRARLTASPDDPVALTRLAGLLARRGEDAEALRLYESAAKANQTNAMVMTHFARYLLGRPEGTARAFELAKAAYKNAPDSVPVLHVLGRSAYLNGDHTWAAGLLGTAARRSPGSSAIQSDLAEAAFAVGQLADAAAAMRAALAADPGSPRATDQDAFLQLAVAAQASPLPPQAEALASSTLARTPESAPALLVSALALEQRGDGAAALAAFEKALAAYPKLTPALARAASLLAAQNPPPARAFDIASRARDAFPGDPAVAAALGTILYRRGEFPRAASLLGEAARAPGASAATYYKLGLAQRQTGDKDRGRPALQRAIELGLSGDDAAEAAKLLQEN